MRKRTTLTMICFFVLIAVWAFAFTPEKKQTAKETKQAPVPLSNYSELKNLKYIEGDIVFVKKNIYGGDLGRNAILRGKIRNITSKGIRNVYVIWFIYDQSMNLYNIYYNKTPSPSIFIDKTEYLDGKAEADFSIDIDLYGGADADSAKKIRESIKNGMQKAVIFTYE